MRSKKEIIKEIKRVRSAGNFGMTGSWWPEAKTLAWVLFPPRKPKKAKKGAAR